VYVASPVDYVSHDEHKVKGNAHRGYWYPEDVSVFCPKCENQYETDVYELMSRNWGALKSASALVGFIDTNSFSFGVPVEIWEKVKENPRRVVVVHRGGKEPGFFVQWLQMQGVLVVCDDEKTIAGGVDFDLMVKSAIADALNGGE
jgi:hypothetical protein